MALKTEVIDGKHAVVDEAGKVLLSFRTRAKALKSIENFERAERNSAIIRNLDLKRREK